MALFLNISESVLDGLTVQVYVISHNGEKIIVRIYKNPTGETLKVKFDGPQSFTIHRYLEDIIAPSVDRR